MEQFLLISASVYNKSLNTQVVKSQEISRKVAEQNRMFQKKSIKKEIDKKLFVKADTLVNKNLFFIL